MNAAVTSKVGQGTLCCRWEGFVHGPAQDQVHQVWQACLHCLCVFCCLQTPYSMLGSLLRHGVPCSTPSLVLEHRLSTDMLDNTKINKVRCQQRRKLAQCYKRMQAQDAHHCTAPCP